MNQVRLRNATDAIDTLLATAELFIEAQEHADAIGALVAARRLASQDRRVPANLAANVTYTLARVLVDMCHFKSGLVCVVDHVTGGGAMAGPRPAASAECAGGGPQSDSTVHRRTLHRAHVGRGPK